MGDNLYHFYNSNYFLPLFMRNVLNRAFLFITILTSFTVQSQITGAKFAPDSTYWRESGSWIISGGPGNFIYTYSYPNQYIKGDTIIGNKYYQKMYNTNRSVFDTVCLGSSILIHYENRKLYLNNSRIYDFGLVLGDTINMYYGWTPNHPSGYYTYTVSAYDSVNIGNKWRKRINLIRPPNTFLVNNIKWVEGIGDINYGFNASYTSLEIILQIGFYKLNCFSEHFQNTYGNGCGISSVCSIVNPTSKIACNSVTSNVNFNIYAGVAPYTFTIQPPNTCSTTYTAISTTTATSFSLTCAGVYTINLKDANNSSLGLVTHTVSLDTLINVPVFATPDTICNTQASTLSVVSSSPNYTLNPITWSNGGSGSAIIVTPNTTTTYSVISLYSTLSTRTCTAKGSKTIIVNSCIGMEEFTLSNFINIYPNPANDRLIIINSFENNIYETTIYTIDGKRINSYFKTNEISVGEIPEGIYYLKFQTDKGFFFRKLVILRS